MATEPERGQVKVLVPGGIISPVFGGADPPDNRRRHPGARRQIRRTAPCAALQPTDSLLGPRVGAPRRWPRPRVAVCQPGRAVLKSATVPLGDGARPWAAGVSGRAAADNRTGSRRAALPLKPLWYSWLSEKFDGWASLANCNLTPVGTVVGGAQRITKTRPRPLGLGWFELRTVPQEIASRENCAQAIRHADAIQSTGMIR